MPYIVYFCVRAKKTQEFLLLGLLANKSRLWNSCSIEDNSILDNRNNTSKQQSNFRHFLPFNSILDLCSKRHFIVSRIVITLDRFFTIIYSNRFGFIKKRSFQIAIISLVVAYNILINVIFQLNYRLNKVKDTWICQVQIDEYKISWTIGLIETFIVNLFVNPIIDFILIRRIIVTRRNVRPINRTIINDRKFAISAIGLNTSSVLLKIPFVLNNLLSIYLNVGPEIASRIYTISLLIVMIDKIDIFFVNMLVNSIFRQEFFNMIKSINNNKKANNKNFINKNTRAQSSLRVREFSRLIPRSPYNIWDVSKIYEIVIFYFLMI